MATAAQAAPIGDEYDLRDGEMTKEMVAAKASVTLRAVEIWKKEGKLPATKLRRRGLDGTVRSQLIFQETDVEQMLKEKDAPVSIPRVEKQSSNLPAVADQLPNLEIFAAMMQQMQGSRLGRFEQLAGQIYVDIDRAAEISGLAKSKLLAEIHDAEANSGLQRFTGDHGRAVWRASDIEKLIELIPPTPVVRRLKPKPA